MTAAVAPLLPAPQVRIEVPAGQGSPLHAPILDRLAEGFARGLDGVRHDLALPVGPASVAAVPGDSDLVQVFVNGRRVRYPPEQLPHVAHLVTGDHETLAWPPAAVWTGLQREGASTEPDGMTRFGEMLARAVLSTRPSILLGPAPGDTLHAMWGASPAWTPAEASSLGARIVDLGIALPDRDRMEPLLQQGAAPTGDGADLLDFAEVVVGESRTRHLELRLSPELFRPVLTSMEAPGEALLASARDGLYFELGVDTSPLHLRADDSLIPGSFVVRVNDLDLLPHLVLREGEILVNDSAERLSLQGVEARPTRNPVSWLPGAIAPATVRDRLEGAGLTVWDRADHVTLSFAGDVRSNAWRLVDVDTVSASLEPLTGVFPRTTRTLESLLGRTTLTRVLRGLLAEGVPVRDFLGIARALVSSVAEAGTADVDGLVERVRADLRWLVSSLASRRTDAVICYLLDPKLERRVATTPVTDDSAIDELGRALAQEISQLPSTALPPCVLVAPEHRRPIHLALAEAFPRVRVVSYAELAPGVHVQPVARVGM